VSRRRLLHPVVGAGLTAARAVTARRLPGMIGRAGASALMLQHRLVTPGAVARAHAVGAPVLAWTVDIRADLERVVAAGVDGVITNDPRLFGRVDP
jgi:glycerophosphoryl diester phosphodiesterase